jgi:hypothetical protein
VRSNEVFARMRGQEAEWFLAELREHAPAVASTALAAAAEAFRLRLQFLRRQPRPRQAEWVRRALARPVSAAAAEELLAEFFLGSGRELLTELLDALGVLHREGILEEPHPAPPPPEKLAEVVVAFRTGGDPERRELLLRAFAAQSAIDWPDLEKLLG